MFLPVVAERHFAAVIGLKRVKLISVKDFTWRIEIMIMGECKLRKIT